jgi:hypothetical protein
VTVNNNVNTRATIHNLSSAELSWQWQIAILHDVLLILGRSYLELTYMCTSVIWLDILIKMLHNTNVYFTSGIECSDNRTFICAYDKHKSEIHKHWCYCRPAHTTGLVIQGILCCYFHQVVIQGLLCCYFYQDLSRYRSESYS